MGWETRKGRRYYYRASRVDGRVVKRYVGMGQLADLLGEFDAADAQRRQSEADARRAERDALNTLQRRVGEVCDLVDELTRAVLLAAGYHQHDRGEWRKRRAPKERHDAVRG